MKITYYGFFESNYAFGKGRFGKFTSNKFKGVELYSPYVLIVKINKKEYLKDDVKFITQKIYDKYGYDTLEYFKLLGIINRTVHWTGLSPKQVIEYKLSFRRNK